MPTFLLFTRADAPKFAKLLSWLFGLPVRGTHHGGGRHVTMPDAVPSPCPLNVPGWTTRHRSWVAKPSNTGAGTDEFAVRLTRAVGRVSRSSNQTTWNRRRRW